MRVCPGAKGDFALATCVVLCTAEPSDFNMFADAIFTNFPLERNSFLNVCIPGIIFMQTASISSIEELSSMAEHLTTPTAHT